MLLYVSIHTVLVCCCGCCFYLSRWWIEILKGVEINLASNHTRKKITHRRKRTPPTHILCLPLNHKFPLLLLLFVLWVVFFCLFLFSLCFSASNMAQPQYTSRVWTHKHTQTKYSMPRVRCGGRGGTGERRGKFDSCRRVTTVCVGLEVGWMPRPCTSLAYSLTPLSFTRTAIVCLVCCLVSCPFRLCALPLLRDGLLFFSEWLVSLR